MKSWKPRLLQMHEPIRFRVSAPDAFALQYPNLLLGDEGFPS